MSTKKSTKGLVEFNVAMAIDYAIGCIVNNQAGDQEGFCDVLVEGHETERLVATMGTVKTIVDLRTNTTVGELVRLPMGRRFEGELYGEKVIGLFTSKYDFYIWTESKMKELGFVATAPKGLAERKAESKARAAAYRARKAA